MVTGAHVIRADGFGEFDCAHQEQCRPSALVICPGAVPSTDVLTTFSLRLVDYHYTQAANAVVLIIAAIAYFGTLLAQKLTRTNLAEGLGS